jgi:hypothetical protein
VEWSSSSQQQPEPTILQASSITIDHPCDKYIVVHIGWSLDSRKPMHVMSCLSICDPPIIITTLIEILWLSFSMPPTPSPPGSLCLLPDEPMSPAHQSQLHAQLSRSHSNNGNSNNNAQTPQQQQGKRLPYH